MNIIHGSNCRCRMVPARVIMLAGARQMVHWLRECQLDPDFWTEPRRKALEVMEQSLKEERA